MALTVPATGRAPADLVVLFAEDDADTRELYTLVYEGRGLTVEVVADGPAALMKASQLHPHVVVLDIALPRLDGFAVCKALKGTGATSAIPVIAATGYWRPDVLDRARDAGFASFILKPHAPDVLLGEIRRLAAFTSRPSSLACPLRTPNLQSPCRTISNRKKSA